MQLVQKKKKSETPQMLLSQPKKPTSSVPNPILKMRARITLRDDAHKAPKMRVVHIVS